MPKGPNRKTVTDDAFLVEQGPRRHLGKIGGVDFADLTDAERDILFDWDLYNSRLQAEQNAPDLKALKEVFQKMSSSLEQALINVRPFANAAGSGLVQQEFNATVSDLLRDAELEPTYFKDTVATVLLELDRLATIGRVLSLKLAERVERKEYRVSSGPALRADFYRRLHQTLSRHGLDTGVGVNSLIVELVLDLQGKASDYADPMERRRKDLATEIKLAVKPKKAADLRLEH
jgi:hypothetical protein